jgi:hypothetical protein
MQTIINILITLKKIPILIKKILQIKLISLLIMMIQEEVEVILKIIKVMLMEIMILLGKKKKIMEDSSSFKIYDSFIIYFTQQIHYLLLSL